MDYQEFRNCVDILSKKPKWFFQREDVAGKLACLDKIKSTGTPVNISFLINFLKAENERIRIKAAETIIHLAQQLKSPSTLYESLKNVGIKKSDINYYQTTFAPDTYLQLLGIASMNRSGHVREKAIKELARSQNPKAIKYILPRLGDWVNVVRESAHHSIKTFFRNEFVEAFLQNLILIEQLLYVQRTDLAGIHSEIISFILSQELTDDFYGKLKQLDDKTRLAYFRNLLTFNDLSEGVAEVISTDKNYLVRNELIKRISKLQTDDQKELIRKFLTDPSSSVRANALHEARRFQGEFNSTILEMSADESARVRELSRHILQEQSINFAEIYRQRLTENTRMAGSILGLSELGSKEDLPIFEKHIQNSSVNVKLACLVAIHRIEPLLSRNYSLNFLSHPSRKIRNKSIDILSVSCDSLLLERTRAMFRDGDFEQRKSILRLWIKVGGWGVIGDLIAALNDSNEAIQNLAWVYLQKWREKATTLYRTPKPDEIHRANEAYHLLDKAKTKWTYYREQLWNELPFYLRGTE